MTFTPVRKMAVSLDLQSAPRRLGTLAWSSGERRAYFEFAPEFLASPLLVSPFHLMANSGVIEAPRDPLMAFTGSSTTACRTAGGGCCSTDACARRVSIIMR